MLVELEELVVLEERLVEFELRLHFELVGAWVTEHFVLEMLRELEMLIVLEIFLSMIFLPFLTVLAKLGKITNKNNKFFFTWVQFWS